VAKASIAGIITTMTAFTVYINSALPTLLGEALTNTVGFILIFMGTFMLAFNLVWLSEPKGAKAIKKHWRWH